MPAVRVGIIGLGNVGGGALKILADNSSRITRKLGGPLEVTALCSRSVLTTPPVEAALFPAAKRTADWREVVAAPDVDIVAELVGGATGGEILDAAIEQGKSIVTANKEVMAERGADIWRTARAKGVRLAMEASVAGGIPIHAVLREGIAGDRVEALQGILNGTCNYILTEMERRGASLESVLAEAQRLGYAEADPTADVEGYDARSKLAILAALAFGAQIDPTTIPTEGIRRIRDIDFLYAAKLNRTVRLIASAKDGEQGLFLSVRPALAPRAAILAHVAGSYNAVWVKGAHGEDTFYYGRGAGPTPTGVAVVSDLMAVARDLTNGGSIRVSPFAYADLEPRRPAPAAEEIGSYYLRFRVRDRPGIIAELAGMLAVAEVGIDSVLQEPSCEKSDLPFVITTEPAPRRALDQALATMSGLDFLVEQPLALPMLDGLAE